MKRAELIGWLVIAYCVALALTLSALAHAGAPTLTERLVAAQPAFASKKDEPVDAQAFAEAVAAVAKGNRQWAALLTTIAIHESGLSARIARGECKSFECDHGLAWGLPQIHRTSRNASVWGSPDIAVQIREESHLARGAFELCKKSSVPFPLSTIRAYAGRGCSQAIKGEADRVATFNRLLRKL